MSSRWWAALGLVALGSGPAAAGDARWYELPVPGGAANLARAAGLDPRLESWRVLLAVFEARRWNTDAVSPLGAGPEDMVRYLDRASALPADAVTDVVPLPLAPEIWRSAILPRDAPRDLLRALLTTPSAAPVYRGLMAVDPLTLALLASDPGAVGRLSRAWPSRFAAFAPSFHVREGRAVPPGDPESRPLWEAAVGETVDRPAAFFESLLDRNGGRLAYLYDTLDRLDEPRRRFALHGGGPGGRTEPERFRALTAAFFRSRAWWDGAQRLPIDPTQVLWSVQVGPDGQMLPPGGRSFWSAAFEGAGSPAAPAETATVDAAWLVEHIALAPPERARERLDMLLLGQRLMGRWPEAEALAVLRDVARRRALVLTLERMGLKDPAPYRAALARADALDRLDGKERESATAAFQGALAVLERSRFARVLDADAARSLVLSLSSVDPPAGLPRSCAVAVWLDGGLRDRLRAAPEASPTTERLLARAVSGDVGGARLPVIEWEGFTYRVDLGAAERQRFEDVRDRQGGPRLDQALAACRAAEAAGSGPARASASALAARSLTSIVYATALGPPESLPSRGDDPAARHDLGLDHGVPGPWDLAEDVVASPWRAQGSLLALDVRLARLSLARLSADLPSHAPRLSPAEVQSFAEGVVLINPREHHAEERAALAAALRRGRARVAAAAAEGRGLPELMGEARVDAVERNALPWVLARSREEVLDLFSLEELRWLGRPDDPGRGGDWGNTARACRSCLGVQIPAPGERAAAEGQLPFGQYACYAADLTLRVAELLDGMALPSALDRAVLARAVQEMSDEIQPSGPGDWAAFSAYARRLNRERVEDYVASLAGGPLVPAGSEAAR